MTDRRLRPAAITSGVLTAVLTLGAASTAAATPRQPIGAPQPAPAAPAPPAPPADPSTVVPTQRDKVLPPNWRTSGDLAWTTHGDRTGFHLLVAEAGTGYTWRTVATLTEPTLDVDQWVGNACLTASGKRAVVVYQPRHFTNRAHLFDRGAFAAVVDIASGTVSKLDTNVSIAYYNPGCGADETAVLTQGGATDLGRTRLQVLDATRARLGAAQEVAGQVTSAVPLGDKIAAAEAGRVFTLDRHGKRTTVARTDGMAAYLRPDSAGGLAFLQSQGDRTAVARYTSGGSTREIARGPLTELGLAAGTGGAAFLTGSPATVGRLPATVRRLDAPAHAEISARGALALTRSAPSTAQPPAERSKSAGGAPAGAGAGTGFVLRAKVLSTAATIDFTIHPAARPAPRTGQGRQRNPLLPAPATAPRANGRGQAAASPTDPVDADRYCSVPRNDVRTQVEQPHWRQVEWAANLAVQNALTFQRPANWRESGLPAWSPQAMLKPIELAGGGRVPAQVMLGILAQESNLWQASWHALEGIAANPLVGSYYGVREGWVINWADADCGYGVAQVTDGMRLAGREKPGERGRDPVEQRAIAMDYATNIAGGLRILQDKWNQTYNRNIRLNDADPARIENWFAAVWAYNSGLNPQATTGNTTGCSPGPSCTDGRGNWGLGWGNNPANPEYPFNRRPFLNGLNGEGSQSDAARPNLWSYPEKVMGWAAFPIVKYDYRRPNEYEGGYQQSWWTSNEARTSAIKPPMSTFCTTANNCSVNPAGQGKCGYADYHCWWHWPVSWKTDCASHCGHEKLAFPPGAAEPESGSHRPPTCSTDGLPANALVVDDQPDTVPIVRSDQCARPTVNRGRFSWQFSSTPGNTYPSKLDLHQLGGGLDGHFWFSHEYNTDLEAAHRLKATGTWQLDQAINGWARVLVHMPAGGGETQQGHYVVDRGANAPAETRYKTRALGQDWHHNRWVPLGVFEFAGTPRVSLANITQTGTDLAGVDNVAWDAIAFEPLPGKPRNFVVAMGDSYSSGEGSVNDPSRDYFEDSNHNGDGDVRFRNGCHRSREAWSRRAFLRDDPQQRSIGQRADAFDGNMDYHFVACSGAQTEHLLPPGTNPITGRTIHDPTTGRPYQNAWGEGSIGDMRELAQMDKGYLDENTTLVTLTIGGNDAKWSGAVKNCILKPLPCQETEIDGVRVGDYIPEMVQRNLPESTMTVLRAIAQLAPNARILLVGYPELVSDNANCLEKLGYGISDSEAEWMNQMARDMASVQSDVAVRAAQRGIKVRFADPTVNGDFSGQGVCGDPETIHGLVLGTTPGEKPGPGPSSHTLHPKVSGAANYASTVNRELRNWGL